MLELDIVADINPGLVRVALFEAAPQNASPNHRSGRRDWWYRIRHPIP
ncbi:hypothetical protein [Mycobacterium talmoniae]|nr:MULTISPECIES: hypothetical protein [Mycobacterium]